MKEGSKGSFESILKTKFGLTEDEAKVYSALLIFGPLTSSAISELTKVSLSKIDLIVEKLVNYGLIKKIEEHPVRFIAFPPYMVIAKKTQTIVEKLISQEKGIKKLSQTNLKSIHKTFNAFSKKVERDLNLSRSKFVERLTSYSSDITSALEKIDENVPKVAGSIENVAKEIGKASESFKQLAEALAGQIDKSLEKYVDANKKLVKKYFNSFKEILDSGFNKETAAIESLIGTVKEIGDVAISQISDTITKYTENKTILINETMRNLMRLEKELNDSFSTFSESVGKMLTSLVKEYSEIMSKRVDGFYGYLSQLTSSIKKETTTRFRDMISSTLSKYDEILVTVKESITITKQKSNELIKVAEDDLKERILEYEKDMSAVTKDISKQIKNQFKKYDQEFLTLARKTKDSVDLVLNDIVSESKNTIPSAAESLIKTIDFFKETVMASTEELKTEINEILQNQINELTSTRDEFSKELKNVVGRVMEDVDSRLKALGEAFERRTTSLKHEILNKLNELRDFSKNQFLAYKEQLLKTNEELYNNLYSKFSGNLSAEIEWINSIIKKIDAFFERNIKGFEEIFTKGQREITKILDLQVKELQRNQKTWVDGVSGMFSQMVTQFSNFVNELESNMISFMENQVTTVAGTLSSTLNLFIGSLNNYLQKNLEESEALKNEIINTFSEYSKSLESLKSETEEVFRLLSENQSQQIETLFSSFEKSTLEHIASSDAAVLNMLESEEKDIMKALLDESKLFKSSLNQLIKLTLSNIDEGFTKSISIVEGAQKTFSDIISKSLASIESPITEAKNKVESLSQTLINAVESMISAEKEDLRKKFDEIIASHKKSSSTFATSMISTLNRSISKIVDDAKTFNEKTLNLLSVSVQDVLSLTDTLENKINDTIEDAKKLHDEELSNITNLFTEMDSKVSSKFEEDKALISEEIAKTLTELQDKFSGNVDTLVNGSKTKINETIESSKSNILNLDEGISSLVSEISKMVTESIKGEFDRFFNTYNEIKNILSNVRGEVSKSLDSLSKELANGSVKLLKSVKDKIAENVQKSIESASSSLMTLNEAIKTDILSVIETFDNSTDLLRTLVLKAISESRDSISSLVDSSIKLISDETAKAEHKLKEQLNTFSNEVTSNIKSLKDDFVEYTDVSKSLWSFVMESLEKRPSHTWYIYSLDANLSYAKDILKRPLDTIILLIPNVDSNILKILEDISEEILVELILSSEIPKESYMQLISKTNFRIWQAKKPFKNLCIINANQEALWIPDVTTQNVIGIATTSSENIEIFQKTIIPYFIKNARKIKRT